MNKRKRKQKGKFVVVDMTHNHSIGLSTVHTRVPICVPDGATNPGASNGKKRRGAPLKVKKVDNTNR